MTIIAAVHDRTLDHRPAHRRANTPGNLTASGTGGTGGKQEQMC